MRGGLLGAAALVCAALAGCSTGTQAESAWWYPQLEEELSTRIANSWRGIPSIYHDRAQSLLTRLLTPAQRYSDACCSSYAREPSPILEAELLGYIAHNDSFASSDNDQAETDAGLWTWNNTAELECEQGLLPFFEDCVVPHYDNEPLFALPSRLLYACADVIQQVPEGGTPPPCMGRAETCRRNGYPNHTCQDDACFPTIAGGDGAPCDEFTPATDAPVPLVSTFGICADGLSCEEREDGPGSFCVPPLGLGMPCSPSPFDAGHRSVCADESVCYDGACVALRGEGETCSQGAHVCGGDTLCICPFNQPCTCTAHGKHPGEPCAEGELCHLGECYEGLCAPLTSMWCLPVYASDVATYPEEEPSIF